MVTRLSATCAALRKSQQVVIPFGIRVCPKIFAGWSANYADVRLFPIDKRVKCICLRFDRCDHLLECPFPARPAEMSNSFVRILARLFINACYEGIRHQ